MKSLLRIYRVINILSLDVVTGSIICALFFAAIFGVAIRPFGMAALALTVWVIYTADHLRDALQIKKPATSARHSFHQHHHRALLVALVVAIMLDLTMLLFIRQKVVIGGVLLAGFIAIYLLIQRRFHFLKEIFVAALYMLGILLPSIAVTNVELNFFHAGLITQFFLISLLNLYIFSFFGAKDDRQDNLGSFVLRFGGRTTVQMIRIMFFINLLLGLVLLISAEKKAEGLIPVVMTIALYFIFRFGSFFGRSEYYRLAGDAIFSFRYSIFYGADERV